MLSRPGPGSPSPVHHENESDYMEQMEWETSQKSFPCDGFLIKYF